MAPRKEVVSLKGLCFQAFQESLESACNDALTYSLDAAETSDRARVAVYENTAETLHHELGNCILHTLDDWYSSVEEELPDQMNEAKTIVGSLAELVHNRKITKLLAFYEYYESFNLVVEGAFTSGSVNHKLCEPVAEVILQNLHKMTGLKILDVIYFTTVAPATVLKCLSDSAPSLSNLEIFSAYECGNDEMLRIITENCPKMIEINVSNSKEVTDAGIDSVLRCAKLETLRLFETSVTSAAVARMIQGIESLKVLILGREHIGVLEILKSITSPSRTYGLTFFGVDLLSNEELRGAAECFPLLSTAQVVCIRPNIFENVSLNLKYLDMMAHSLNLIFNSFISFLSCNGSTITDLSLEIYDEVTGRKIVDICARCPNIQTLRIQRKKSDDFDEEIDCFADLQTSDPTLLISIKSNNPFEKLKEINIDFDKSLIKHTPNVEVLNISNSSLPNEFFKNVFQFNQFEHLKCLRLHYNKGLSSINLKIFIANCEKLKYLSFMTKREKRNEKIVKDIQKFIAVNNYDVDFDFELYDS